MPQTQGVDSLVLPTLNIRLVKSPSPKAAKQLAGLSSIRGFDKLPIEDLNIYTPKSIGSRHINPLTLDLTAKAPPRPTNVVPFWVTLVLIRYRILTTKTPSNKTKVLHVRA